MLISLIHIDNQQKKSWTLFIIYLSLVALWTCFVHTLYGPIPSIMHRALFYAYYALHPFLIYIYA